MRRYTPPMKVRKEPKTRQEILDEIKFLEDKLNGRLNEAIEDRIEALKKKLEQLNDIH